MPLPAEKRAMRQNDYRAVTGLPDHRRVTVFSAVITGRDGPGHSMLSTLTNAGVTKSGMCQRLDRGRQPDPRLEESSQIAVLCMAGIRDSRRGAQGCISLVEVPDGSVVPSPRPPLPTRPYPPLPPVLLLGIPMLLLLGDKAELSCLLSSS
jgi:hypothetical protein